MLFYLFLISLVIFIFASLVKFETPINIGIAVVAGFCGILVYNLNLAGKISDTVLIVGTIINTAISLIIILVQE